MSTTECRDGVKTLERTRFFTRQLITADDLTNEQLYQREKRRMHNRLLHGWGIVCGLNVVATAGSHIVTICPGYALSPQGDEIYLAEEIKFDLSQNAKAQVSPCSPCGSVSVAAVDTSKPFYIAIKYTECMSSPVRVSPVGCGCDDTACEYSRIRDSFEITCLQSLPTTHSEKENITQICEAVNKVNNMIVPCTSCPSDPWIVLAKISINAANLTITNNDRVILLPVTMMVNKCSER
ncbi:MAG: hypothetical protein V4732_08275 [Pseudomonadota bacterium]